MQAGIFNGDCRLIGQQLRESNLCLIELAFDVRIHDFNQPKNLVMVNHGQHEQGLDFMFPHKVQFVWIDIKLADCHLLGPTFLEHIPGKWVLIQLVGC